MMLIIKGFRSLFMYTFLFGIGLAIHHATIKNYLLDELHFSENQYGWIDGIREIPGLMAIASIIILSRLTEKKVFIIATLAAGLGLLLFSTANHFSSMMLFTFIFSSGMHMWYIMQGYFVTQYSSLDNRALRFGQLTSLSAASNLLGIGLV